MKSKTYKIGKREVKVTDRKILDIVEKTENLEISPEEASEQLTEYLLSDHSIPLSEYCEKLNLWETIVLEFKTPCRGRLTSSNERYAIKHGLSGRLTT